MTEIAPSPLVDMAREVIEQARDDWLRSNQNDFVSTVDKMMNSARDDLILSVLGFEKDSFGRGKTWKIDHCNGRSGQSFVGEEIATRAKAAVAGVFNAALESWEPTPELLAIVYQEFTSSVQRYVVDYARAAGAHRAQEIVDKLVANL